MSRIQQYLYFRSKGLSLMDSLDYSELLEIIAYTLLAAVAIGVVTMFLYLNPHVLMWLWGGHG